MSIKNIKLEYYTVTFRNKLDKTGDKDKLFDLDVWIQEVLKLTIVDRTIEYGDDKARFEDAGLRTKGEKYWFLSFLRLIDPSTLKRARSDQPAEDLELGEDEFIGTDLGIIYDEQTRVLMLQKNIKALGHLGVQFYLNEVWKRNHPNDTIYLNPIPNPENIFNRRPGGRYTKFSIKYADIRNIKFDNMRSSLKNFTSGLTSTKTISGEITMSVGRYKQDLDTSEIDAMIDDIRDNKDEFKNAILTVKYADGTPIEVYDLMSNGLCDYIQTELPSTASVASQYLEDLMWEKFNNKRGILINLLGLNCVKKE